MTNTTNELKLAFTVDHRPVIDQWTDSVLDVIKDDLVYDSREEVKGILLDFKKSVRRVCSTELTQAVAEERARIRENLPKIITPTVEPPPNNLSQNQIFASGQMNMLLRVTDLLSSLDKPLTKKD